jgi:hypothetical protein
MLKPPERISLAVLGLTDVAAEGTIVDSPPLLFQKDAGFWRQWREVRLNTSEMLTPLMERRGLSGLSGSFGLFGLFCLFG